MHLEGGAIPAAANRTVPVKRWILARFLPVCSGGRKATRMLPRRTCGLFAMTNMMRNGLSKVVLLSWLSLSGASCCHRTFCRIASQHSMPWRVPLLLDCSLRAGL